MMKQSSITEAQKIIEQLIELGLSQARIGKEIGLSASAISQIKSNVYAADVTPSLAKLKALLARQKTKEEAPVIGRCLPFVETTVSKAVYNLLYSSGVYGEFSVIYSEAGYGKTYAIKEYVKQFPETVLVEADSDYTSKVLFAEINRALGEQRRGTLHAIKEDVISRLKHTNRLIIIDEAEHLRAETLDLLRRIYDKTDIGLVLVGMPELKHNIEGSRGQFKQLWSRIDAARKLPAISAEDIKKIVLSVLPSSSADIIATFTAECNNNTRVLSKLIRSAHIVAHNNNTDITPRLIKQAGNRLLYKGI